MIVSNFYCIDTKMEGLSVVGMYIPENGDSIESASETADDGYMKCDAGFESLATC